MTASLVAIISLAIAFLLGRASTRWEKVGPDEAPFVLPQEDDQERVPMTLGRFTTLVFITGWIIAWTAGIFMVGQAALAAMGSETSGPQVFMIGWLIAAIAGWCYAAHTIFKLLTGRPVKKGWD